MLFTIDAADSEDDGNDTGVTAAVTVVAVTVCIVLVVVTVFVVYRQIRGQSWVDLQVAALHVCCRDHKSVRISGLATLRLTENVNYEGDAAKTNIYKTMGAVNSPLKSK